jgi:DNA-binding GntR family transcriptional regulator
MAGQTDAIVATLVDRIDAGLLAPGAALDEQRLAAEFGVSRTPVREALLTLEALGILTRRPRGGATVFRPDAAQFLAILEVHAGLEGWAAGLAARRLTGVGAEGIARALAACEAHLARHGEAEGDAYYQCNMRFHAAVAEASGNRELLEQIKTNARRLMAYYRRRYRIRGSIAASVDDHRRIVAVIEAGDAAGAGALMAAHVQFDSATAMDLLAQFDGDG